MAFRFAIPLFQTANSKYASASVTFWTVDEDGVKTSTKATLYDSPTGVGTLSNPVGLDSEGKFEDFVYVEVPVIASIDISSGDHDTAILAYVIRARGDWAASGTIYAPGDFVSIPSSITANAYDVAICNIRHASGASFPVDLSDGKWTIIIDASDISDAAAAAAAGFAADAEAAKDDAEAAAVASIAAKNQAETAETNAETAQAAAQAAASAVGFPWIFDANTAMADPGVGEFRFNNADMASVTAIAVSAQSADAGNPDVSADIATWAASTNTTGKGALRIKKRGTPGTFGSFKVTGVTDNGAWLELAVTYVAHNGAWSAADVGYGAFSGTGDKGLDGTGLVNSVTAADATIVVSGSATDPEIAVTPATDAQAGATRFATPTEARTGTATDIAVTPEGAKAVVSQIPINSQSGAGYTAVAADAGKAIMKAAADTSARTYTIPPNGGGGAVPFEIGTAITFINRAASGNITIAITTDTLIFSPSGGTGSRTLAPYGMATAIKVAATEWMISGTGLT